MNTLQEIEKRLNDKAERLAWVDVLLVCDLTGAASTAQMHSFTEEQFMELARVGWNEAAERMAQLRPGYREAAARAEIKANMAAHEAEGK